MSRTPWYSAQRPRSRRDGRRVAQQRLRGELAERDDHLRPDRPELRAEERLAGGDLVGLGVPVAGRAALHHVRDVDLLAAEAHRLDHAGEELAGTADEGLSLPGPRRRRAPRPRTPARRPGFPPRRPVACVRAASLQRVQSPSSRRMPSSASLPHPFSSTGGGAGASGRRCRNEPRRRQLTNPRRLQPAQMAQELRCHAHHGLPHSYVLAHMDPRKIQHLSLRPRRRGS